MNDAPMCDVARAGCGIPPAMSGIAFLTQQQSLLSHITDCDRQHMVIPLIMGFVAMNLAPFLSD